MTFEGPHGAHANSRISRYVRTVAAIGAFVSAVGVLVLVGWIADLPALTSLRAGWATMKPNTALGFVLLGQSLFWAAGRRSGRVRRTFGLASAAAALVIGFLTVLEYVSGVDLGIDWLLPVGPPDAATAYPGRMALATAINFTLIGAALVLSGMADKRARQAAAVLPLLTIASSYVAILGYAYNLSALYSVGPYSSVALHTAALFLLLGVGCVVRERRRGLMRLFASPYAGGRAVRELLPLALLASPTLGWLVLTGQKAGLYQADFGVAVFVVAHVLVFTVFILSKVGALDDADAVRREEIKFRGLLESSPEAMVIVDRSGRIVLINAQTEQLFGYPREELAGLPIETLMPERSRTAHVSQRSAFLAAPRTRSMGQGLELVGLRRDGSEFSIEVSLSPVGSGETFLVSSTVRDITERKRVIEQLSEARIRAEAASRAKSDFLSNMSHELRTPLNSVLGFAQLLELDAEQNRAVNKEYVGYILSSGRHLLRLVNDVLDLAGIESGRLNLSMEAVSPDETVKAVINTLSPVAKAAGVSLKIAESAGPRFVRADSFRLRQALLNLASNAVKYNRPGGSVTFATAERTTGTIRFTITDTGIGIAPGRQAELFEPFQRLGAEHSGIEGTGIGLAISRRIVEAMNGRIGFTSEPGQGSEFWIELPEAAAGAAVIAAASPGHPARHIGGFSLLYIEDNPSNLRLLERIVSTLPNVSILMAATPQQGLDMALAHRPDVVVLDLNLPEMDGYEVLAQLQSRPETRSIPVLALTAAAHPRDVKRGLAAGFFRYLTKPLDVVAFLAAIEDALAAAPARRAGIS